MSRAALLDHAIFLKRFLVWDIGKHKIKIQKLSRLVGTEKDAVDLVKGREVLARLDVKRDQDDDDLCDNRAENQLLLADVAIVRRIRLGQLADDKGRDGRDRAEDEERPRPEEGRTLDIGPDIRRDARDDDLEVEVHEGQDALRRQDALRLGADRRAVADIVLGNGRQDQHRNHRADETRNEENRETVRVEDLADGGRQVATGRGIRDAREGRAQDRATRRERHLLYGSLSKIQKSVFAKCFQKNEKLIKTQFRYHIEMEMSRDDLIWYAGF